jgi:hypothetical protein
MSHDALRVSFSYDTIIEGASENVNNSYMIIKSITSSIILYVTGA